jgi:hypothetical protein
MECSVLVVHNAVCVENEKEGGKGNMSKVLYMINPASVLDLAKKGIISAYQGAGGIIVARHGVNKETLKKLLKKEKA